MAGDGFDSEKEYLIIAKREFTRKYGVKTPWEATRGHPERMREWCALVYAMKKVYDDTWLDGGSLDKNRRDAIRREIDERANDSAKKSRRREKPDRERDH